jgi:pimeloyl-ACP methyl ester carboxylesterase
MPAAPTLTVEANGVTFACLTAGTDDGPLALLLHGFPDTAHGWRHLAPVLGAAGYRVVMPFMRGYAPTEVPADGRFQAAVLAVDANRLHEALGGDDRAVIVGHDWGAAATYGAVNSEPERWRRVVGMAVPPGPALMTAFLTDVDQLRRSWYMFFFQHPFADLVVPADDLAFIDRLWADWSPGYADRAGDVAAVKDALRDPAHLAAALGYYRATLGAGLRDPALDPVEARAGDWPSQPTLYLHGRDDGCVGPSLAEATAASAPAHVRVEIVDAAGHFLQLEQPDAVARLVLEHLA